jgi:hypothetical protein
MKKSKRSRWMIGVAVLLILLSISLSQAGIVRAVFDGPQDAMVLYRVFTEILPGTPGGRYYLDLFIKHGPEIAEIVNAHPEHEETLVRTTHLFIPGFEALLNGKGDTVHITTEQVDALQDELDWFASTGSPALQEDIEKERQRLPLDQFAGVTMNDALDMINSSWTPDLEGQLPFIELQKLSSSQPVLIKDVALIPHSAWKWAYYSINEVYLEYSSNLYIEISKIDEHRSMINFMPRISVPFVQSTPVIAVQLVQNIPLDENAKKPTMLFGEENVVWKSNIHNPDFDGIEFVVKFPNSPQMSAVAVLYSETDQLAVGLQTQLNEGNVSSDVNYSVLLDQKYEYFQHMIENIRLRTP